MKIKKYNQGEPYLKRFLFWGFILMISMNGYTQSEQSKNKLFFKLGYSNTFQSKFQHQTEVDHLKHPSVLGEFSFRINRLFDVGINGGYSPKMLVVKEEEIYNHSQDWRIWMYGVHTIFHILPLFVDANDFRIDVYTKAKVGLASHQYLAGQDYDHQFDYGIYGGLAFYPTKHFGIFCEGGYGKGTKLMFGFCGKF